MADAKQLAAGKTVYKTLCSMLDGIKWSYKKHDDELYVETGATGDDLKMNIRIEVDEERQLVVLYSQLPYTIPENKRVDVSFAVSAMNYTMVDGSFDYNFLSGDVLFRLTSSFQDSLIGEEALKYVLMVSCSTVDKYNDVLFAFIKDKISLEDVFKKTMQ